MELTFDTIKQYLVEQFPNLSDQVRELEEESSPDPPGVYDLFIDVFDPYVRDIYQRRFESGNTGNEEAELVKVFAFLEEFSSHEDPNVRDVVAIQTLNDLFDSHTRLRDAVPRLGPESLKRCHALAEWKIDPIQDLWRELTNNIDQPSS